MSKNIESVTVDRVNLERVRWINCPNKVLEREMILLVLHQKGTKTKSQLIKEGVPRYRIDTNLDYLQKRKKIKEEEGTQGYSRTTSRHKFHYEDATGRLE